MNIKKILVSIGFLLFVVAIGFALYFVFFKPSPIGDTTGGEDFQPGVIPGIGDGDPTIVDPGTGDDLPWQNYLDQGVSEFANGGYTEVNSISEGPVKGITSGSQGTQYYDEEEQKFFRLDEDGVPVALSDEKFFGIEEITWEENGEKAIIEYPDGRNILYNFATGKQVTLPAELQDFSFNKNANQIAAEWIGDREDNNWLVTANDDGSGLRLVEAIGDQAHNVQVGVSPDNQVAALFREYVDAQRQEVYPIGFNQENLKSFVVDGAGFTSKWSENGDTLLYSVYNQDSNYNPTLWATPGNTSDLGSVRISLNLQTWPEKCTFASGSDLICAVPQGLLRGTGMAPELSRDYRDNFYSINLNTGARVLLASPVGEEGKYSAESLSISSDGSTLYFIDANTGKLQEIKLK